MSDFAYGHVMPQAPEIEKAVLGALMIDKDAYLKVCDLLRPESFYEPRNQMVYEAIQLLSADESPVDVLTVTDKLGKMGKLEEVGGPSYIADLSSRVATSASIEYHANIVAEKFLARQMIHYVSVIGKKTFDETYDIKDVVQEAESTLFELSQRNMKKEYSVLSPIVDKALDLVKLAHANQGGLKVAPLYIDDTESLSVMELRTKARRLVKEHGGKLIMIDYLQLMTASGMRYNSRQEEVSLISRSLKGLAKELNIPVLALSQLNRGVESRVGPEGKRPQLSDLRESGAIEQDADMVIFLHRPEYYGILMSSDGLIDYKDKAEVIISKHRKGGTGIIMMEFKGE